MTKIDSGDHGVLADFEHARLATLDSLELLDTPPEREFDAIVQLAQRLTGYKIALVSPTQSLSDQISLSRCRLAAIRRLSTNFGRSAVRT